MLGATGYVGRLVVPALGAAGAHVRATARRPEELTGVPHAERACVVAGDTYALVRALKGADVVCDLWPATAGATAEIDEAAAGARLVRVRCLLDDTP
ncbi:MAG: NAD(P)H-binding protein, partial [Gaiellales bacterium]